MAKKSNRTKGSTKPKSKDESNTKKDAASPTIDEVTEPSKTNIETVEVESKSDQAVIDRVSLPVESLIEEKTAESLDLASKTEPIVPENSESAPKQTLKTSTETQAVGPESTIDNSNSNPIPSSVEPSENTRSPTPTPAEQNVAAATVRPKKRLTLQERLALAAKGKSKLKDGASPSTSVPSSSQNSAVTSPVLSPEPTTEISEIKSNDNEEFTKLKQKIADLKAENIQLTEKINTLSKASAKGSSTSWEKQKTELMEKLSQKEETIKQLMKEGEALSMKELKLNDSIKKLKSKNLELEENLYDYSLKSEDSSTKLSELENLIKIHGFKTVDQLINEFNGLSKQVSEYKAQLSSEQSWEKKYQDQQKILDSELVKSKEYGIQLNDMKISMDLIKQEHQLEIDSKNSIIESLKQETAVSNQTYSDEISRLENKVESLRIEREYIPRQSNGEADTKSIDIEEFTKLSENHHNLQQQYLTSQENWKLIESNLLTKVDDLTTSLEMTKKAKLKLANDFKRVNASLNEQINKVKLLEEKIKEISEKKEQLELELELKDNDYHDLQQKADTFKKLYESDKANLNVKIKSLQETIDQMKKNELVSPKGSISRLESGVSINDDSRNHSLPDIYDNPNWDMKYNDPLSTSKANSQIFYDSLRNISENSLADEEEALDTFNDDSRSIGSHGFSHNQSFTSMANSGNNRNIQLINKMSAATRRLEVEIHTLKEENAQLTTEMEQMQQSLLEKYKLDEQMKQLNQQIDDLNLQLQHKNKKEETMLELIGEKTEQVEELRADVQDLKDLCKLQVQQMIEIQESK